MCYRSHSICAEQPIFANNLRLYSRTGNGSSASTASFGASNDEFVPPFRGETRAQVIAQYDEPDQVFQSSETGETWVYFFGKAKQFIPFYGPFAERRILVIHFISRAV
jgi:hypothetical protein